MSPNLLGPEEDAQAWTSSSMSSKRLGNQDHAQGTIQHPETLAKAGNILDAASGPRPTELQAKGETPAVHRAKHRPRERLSWKLDASRGRLSSESRQLEAMQRQARDAALKAQHFEARAQTLEGVLHSFSTGATCLHNTRN